MIPHPCHRPVAQVGLRVVREAGRGEDQREGEVGGGLVEHTGRVAHDHAVLARGSRTSTLSYPTATFATTRNVPAAPASSTAASILSVSTRDDRVDVAGVARATRRA